MQSATIQIKVTHLGVEVELDGDFVALLIACGRGVHRSENNTALASTGHLTGEKIPSPQSSKVQN